MKRKLHSSKLQNQTKLSFSKIIKESFPEVAKSLSKEKKLKSESLFSKDETSQTSVLIESSLKIAEEGKMARRNNELKLINKGLNVDDPEGNKPINNHREYFNNLSFPLIIKSNIGLGHDHNFLKENNYLSDKYLSLEILKKEYKYNDCLDLTIKALEQKLKVGYISKDISTVLHESFKSSLLNHYFILKSETLDLFIIVNLDTTKEIFSNHKFEISGFFYKVKYSFVIPFECVKVINKLSQFKLFSDESLIGYLKLLIAAPSNKLTPKVSDSYELEEDSTLEFNEDNNLNLNNYTDFLIKNIDKILFTASEYHFLFSKQENKLLLSFTLLDELEKEVLSKFLTRSSLWISSNKLGISDIKIQHSLNKLVSSGFLCKFNTIFSGNNYNKTELFTYLYYLTNDNLRIISKEVQKIIKYTHKLNDNEIVCDQIFLNNAFFKLDNYMDFEIFQYLTKSISKEISIYNINKKVSKFETKNLFNYGKRDSSDYNKKYISTYLNSTNFKKVKLSKVSNPQKFAIISMIIKFIDLFINDKSCNVMDSFLKNSILKNEKLEKIFEIFLKFELFSLNEVFAKIFDTATRLFFFYTEYRDINDLSRQFYGFENFEKYDNFVDLKTISKATIEDLSHLKPIFTENISFKLYDNLHQMKTAFLMNAMIFNDHNLNFGIVKKLSFVLMSLNNKAIIQDNIDLEKEGISFTVYDRSCSIEQKSQFNDSVIAKLSKLSYDDTSSLDNEKTDSFIDRLMNLLMQTNFEFVIKNFLSKFRYEYISAELLNYFAECCEKVKNYKFAALIYYFLLLNKYLYKKRGLWWYRLILINRKYLKDKVTSVKLLNKAHSDPFIKSGYFVKIKQYYELFEKEKNSEKNIKKDYLNILEKFNWSESGNEYDQNLFLKKKRVIQADSLYSKFSGRRLYNVGEGISTVENYALDYYYKFLNLSGVHGENLILPSLYNLFMWDVIYYDKVPYVFQSSFQTHPLDFFSEDFYYNRQEIIERRTTEISSYKLSDINDWFDDFYAKKKGIKSVFIQWENPLNSKDTLKKVSVAIGPIALAKIFLEFSKNLKFMIKGMPDLFLWKQTSENNKSKIDDVVEGSAMLVEVKSKNDKLSEYQKYWLSFLTKINLSVEVLHIE